MYTWIQFYSLLNDLRIINFTCFTERFLRSSHLFAEYQIDINEKNLQ